MSHCWEFWVFINSSDERKFQLDRICSAFSMLIPCMCKIELNSMFYGRALISAMLFVEFAQLFLNTRFSMNLT